MKYSLKFRTWHWLNAIVIFALFITVGLRESFLNLEINSAIILDKLSTMSISITQEQAKEIALALRDEMWQWHIYIGYALIALMLFRIFLIFKDNSNKDGFFKVNFHKKMVKIIYFAFYLVVIFISASGIALTFHQELNIAHELVEEIEEMHEIASNTILGFITIHLLGVIIAENKNESGIVSDMINGKKEVLAKC